MLLLHRRILPSLGGGKRLRVLHLAPEKGIERTLRGLPNVEYRSGDIEPGRAMERVDLTSLEFADDSFDFLFLSHVLEHILDDRLALREIRRVLPPGGAAFIEVPVLSRVTYEDSSLTTAEERLRAFGQVDHVRICGLDYAERLVEAGFVVEPLWIDRCFTAREVEHMRLRAEASNAHQQAMARFEEIFHVSWLCTKP